MVAIATKNGVKISSGLNEMPHFIPGTTVLKFNKPPGLDLSNSRSLQNLTFESFVYEDSGTSYLPSGRISSSKISSQVYDQLGSRGRGLVENLGNMESASELLAGLSVINETLLAQRSGNG